MNRNLAARIVRAVALALGLASGPALAAGHVVISQVYGGGGGAAPVTYKRDYVELFNPTSAPVSLGGWSLQYGSATGTANWSVHVLPASLSIGPGQYLLIEEGGGTAGADLPVAPDVSAGPLNMSATTGKVALVSSATALSGACPSAGVVDQVGFGTANCAEGGAATAALSKETGAVRKSAGCTDTDNNAADFDVVANPVPRNGSSPTHACSVGGRMRITEFMYSGANGEFVEFTNVGDQPVDMTGWSYADSGRTPGDVALGAFGTVQPGESVILTETAPAAFRSAWGLCSGVKVIGGNTVDNLGRGDEINLYDASQAQVDRLTFGDNVAGVGGPRTQNASAWPSAAALGQNQITGWTLSTVGDAEGSQASAGADVGSPGRSTRALVAYDPCAANPDAPQVGIDAATTSPFLDLAPSGEGAVGAVVGDPTDPAATEGIGLRFALPGGGDPSTLTITAVSSNADVIDAAGVQLSGSGATRLLKLVPRGVGYATITVSATDASNATGTYVIHYAASAAAPFPANTVFLAGASDASAAVKVDDLHMLVSDDETNVLRLYRRDRSGLPLRGFDFSDRLNLTDAANPEIDIEASARVGDRVFWSGSFSNSKNFHVRPNRHRVFATDVSGSGAATTLAYAGRYDWLLEDLVAWDHGNGHGLGADYLGFAASSAEGVDSKTPAGFNVEGLAIAPDGTTAYLAFRAPQLPTTARHQALIVPVLDIDALVTGAAPDSRPQGSASFGAPIFLDLGGRGIRSLDRNAAGQYLITAGAAGDTGPAPDDFRLYAWTGRPLDAPVELGADLSAQDIAGGSFEALAEVPETLGADTILQALLDTGDSVWYGDGIVAKDLAEPRFKKAPSVRLSVDVAYPAGTVAASAGTPQSANVNQRFAAPLVVRVTDAYGHGVANAVVSFAAPASGASAVLDAASATTGADGLTSIGASANAIPGSYSVVASVAGASSSASFALTNLAAGPAPVDHVVISQVYGGGGATSLPATYKRDYIELFNPTGAAIDLGGWSLQYASATGTGNWIVHALPASLSIGPGRYLLIEEGGGTVGGDLPLAPDVAGGPLNLAQSNGKIALVSSATALSGACPSAGVVDQVGYGTANCHEGSAAVAALGKETGAVRKDDGCTDTDDNAADFDVVTNPVPRNAASPANGCGGAGSPITLSVGDVTVTAPASGTAPADFDVRLSRAAASDVQFDVATVDGTAVAGVDYVAAQQTGATIAAGATTFRFTVQINANATPGAPKTFKLRVTNVAGGDVVTTSAEGTGTILSSAGLRIGDIQGDGAHPARLGQTVTFSGTVTAIGAGGYFVQDAGDGNPLTSDALFVYGSTPAGLAVGSTVDVTGTVAEFYGMAEITGATTTITGSGALPPAVALDAATPSADPAHPRCEGGSFVAGDSVAVRNWRCLQSMRVTLADGAISAPNFRSSSQPLSEAYAYVASHPRPFRGPGLPYGTTAPSPPPGYAPPVWDAVPYVFGVDTGHLMSPQALNGGVRFSATGVMGFDFGIGMLWPTEFTVTDPGPAYPLAVPAAPAGALTIGSQNMLRLFNDVHDSGSIDACADSDPGSSDVCPTTAQFQVRLKKLSRQVREVLGAPAVLGVQEIENLAALQALADQIHADDASLTYRAYLQEGNDVGGIDVGVLVRGDVTVNAVTQLNKNETTTAGCSSSNPPPCLLNDRPPLLLDASFGGERFAVLVIHNRSLSNVETQAYVRAKRFEQAKSVARIVQAWQTGDAAAVPGATAGVPLAVVGDYNAFEFTDGYVDVTGIIRGTAVASENLLWDAELPIVVPPLADAGETVPEASRYSFSFDGYMQDLDHGLLTEGFRARLLWMAASHGNADVPAGGPDGTDPTTARRSADHDGFVMAFSAPAPTTWTVTPAVAGGHGTIGPAQPVTVADGATTSFTLTPDAGYHVDVIGGTCAAGTLAANVYTTGPIHADCTIVASFAANAAAAIAVTGGDGQSAVVNHAFDAPLAVRVTDAGGLPVAGATVTFSVPASGAGATLSATTAVTDADGRASVQATANGVVGSYVVQASVTGVTTPAAFDLSNLEDASDVIFRNGFEAAARH